MRSSGSNVYARGLGHSRADLPLGIAAWSAVVLITVVFGRLLFDLLRHGLAGLSWEYLVSPVAASGRAGGIGPVLVSTLLILMVCLVVVVPLGLATAVLLAEFSDETKRRGLWIRRSLDLLAGVPSIVFGLFGNALFCVALGMGFSILSGGLTLACMVLPIFVREAEEGLRAVPRSYRLSAAALGLSRGRSLLLILLPAAAPGILVGLVLGIGRALAETAALIFTSGYVDRMPESVFDSGRSLSIHIYDLSMNVSGGEPRASTAAVVLVALLLLINWTAGRLAHRWHRHGVSVGNGVSAGSGVSAGNGVIGGSAP